MSQKEFDMPGVTLESMNSQELVDRVDQLSLHCTSGDFTQVIERLSEALRLNPGNYTLYSNRAAAYMRVGKFKEALTDAKKVLELKPDWTKGYYRQGAAYVAMEKFDDGLVAFSRGLATDQKQSALLDALVETMAKSPYRDKFKPKYEKFQSLKLDRNPFIIVSMVGQELMSASRHKKAVEVLESARRIGTDSEKLEASLHQALGQVYWSLGNTDKALAYMRSDLSINSKLADNVGICRAQDNLGMALCSLGKLPEALEHHTLQFTVARNINNTAEMYAALNRLARVHGKMGRYQEALQSYKEALKLAKASNDHTSVMECTYNCGMVYKTLNELDKAINQLQKYLQMAQQSQSKEQQAEAYASLGQVYQMKGSFDQAMMFYQQLLSVAVQMNNASLKARAYGGMGQANLNMGNLWYAQMCREQQLKLTRELGDKEFEAIALRQLGNIHKTSGKISQAMQYYQESLEIVMKLKDRGVEGMLYSDIGSCYMAMGNLRDAVKYYESQLAICTEMNDQATIASTNGSLGMAYLSLDNKEAALKHLNLSKELAEALHDKQLQCEAHSNLGSYHTKCKEYRKALTHLEPARKLAAEKKDQSMESKVCHNLGICHEALGNHQQAIQFFTHDLVMAKEAKDKEGVSRACEKLINAYTEIGDREQAEVYKQQLVNIARDFDHTSNKCALLNKMAEDMLNSGDFTKAIEFYEQLLKGAENEQHLSFKGQAYSGLGNTYMANGKPDRALSYYQQDLTIRKGTSDFTGECQAYANMGSAYNCLGQHQEALRCYMANLDLAKQLENPVLIAKALSCVGIVQRNLGSFEEALQYHQQQLAVAQSLTDNIQEQAQANKNLGESHEALGDHTTAIQYLSQYLSMAHKIKDMVNEIMAHSCLGRACRGLGDYQQSLQHFQSCMKGIKDTKDDEMALSCYADIASVHMKLGNFEQALQAHMRQYELAHDMEDIETEAIAASCLGDVYQSSGNYKEALHFHQQDLLLSRKLRSGHGQMRAFGNLAQAYEAIEEFDKAIEHWEQQSALASSLRDESSKAQALTGLGIVNIRLDYYDKAISLLTQAWGLVGDMQDESVEIKANILYNLGLAYFNTHDYQKSCASLRRAVELFENMLHQGDMSCHTSALVSKYSHLLQVLIHTLVRLNKVEEALETAERERSRQVVELLQIRSINLHTMRKTGILRPQFLSAEGIQEVASSLKTPIVYYSIALGHLFTWLIHPQGGVVQFKQRDLSSLDFNFSETASMLSHCSTSSTPLVEKISELREGLGLPRQVFTAHSSAASMTSEDLDWDDDSISIGSNDVSGKDSPRHGFMAGGERRNHIPVRTRSIYSPPNLQPIQDLYSVLIRPIESGLPKQQGTSTPLIIIPDKDLFLIPYSLLRGDSASSYLHQRFQLHISLSIQSLISKSSSRTQQRSSVSRLHSVSPEGDHRAASPTSRGTSTPVMFRKHSMAQSQRGSSTSLASTEVDFKSFGNELDIPFLRSGMASPVERPSVSEPLVIGNPATPASDTYLEPGIMYNSERETRIIADLLETKPLLGETASKDRVLRRMATAGCIHFCTGMSWNESVFVLAPRSDMMTGSEPDFERSEGDGTGYGRRGQADGAASGTPEPVEYLMSANEILQSKLTSKLVTVSGCYRTKDQYLTSGGVITMAAAFLAAGAQAVLVPLWPTSNQASRLMMNAFYSSLLYGSRASRALGYAMQTVSSNKKYAHPIHWAGYLLIGKNIILKDRSVEMAAAFRSMLQASEDYLVAGLKVLQAMVTSSIKRVQEGAMDPKYTSEQMIDKKIGPVPGWKELLKSVGFHFISPISRDVPSTVIFPEHDDSHVQRRCRKFIDSLLGLPAGALKALQLLAKHPTAATSLLNVLHKASVSAENGDCSMTTQIDSLTWIVRGSQEFLSSLGFETTSGVSHNITVHVKSPVAEQGQVLDYAINSLLAVFGPEEQMEMLAPRPVVSAKPTEELAVLC